MTGMMALLEKVLTLNNDYLSMISRKYIAKIDNFL